MWSIYASEVAALIDKHVWQNKYETIMKILDRNGHVKYESRNTKAVKLVTKKLELSTSAAPLTTVKLQKAVEKGLEQKKLSGEEAQIVLSQAVAIENQTTGTHAEKVLVKTEDIKDNNRKLYEEELSENCVLIGRCDGMRNGKLVEIKRRTRTINMHQVVPEYDYVQCFCYLKLTGQTEMTMIEIDNKKNQRDTTIVWNERRWTEIEQAILQTIHALDLLVENERKLHEFNAAGQAQDWSQCQQVWYRV